jgi:hypothetical protein
VSTDSKLGKVLAVCRVKLASAHGKYPTNDEVIPNTSLGESPRLMSGSLKINLDWESRLTR